LLALSTGELRQLWGARIAYVAQSAAAALNPAIPVGRQLAQVLETHLGLRGDPLRAGQLELFAGVGLPDPEGALVRYPFEFSGGQQQRIAIAIAIACRPEVLILDEPTTGLDVTTQARISSLVGSLVLREGIAALYVSHDLALLAAVTNRLAVMYAGEIVEQGSTAEVIRRPAHPYTRALLAAAPSVRERRAVTGIPGSPPPRVVADACAFAPRCAHVLPACREDHIALRDLAAGHLARCIRADELVAKTAQVHAVSRTAPRIDVVLELQDVWCEYAKASTPAVRSASLTLSRGETIGIVGESGSGKSTCCELSPGYILRSAA